MHHLCVVVVAIAASGILFAQQSESTSANPSSAARTVWHGVYTPAQAARGQESYTTHCASCHRDDLSGYDSLLRGERFMTKYREASLNLLFEKTKNTMPRDAAGSLSDQTYIDIISYVLKMNEFPSGAEELRVEDVAHVRLVGKGGPEPVPNFSLVLVVGCLGRSGDDWVVSQATEPVRTGNPRRVPEELSTGTELAGTNTFGLMASAAYAPATHAGRTVEVRGFLMRRTNDARINVTSLEPVGPPCGP